MATMRTILGIDPGLRKTGWGVISQNGSEIKYIACGTIKSNDKDSLCERLKQLSEGLQKVIHEFDPDEAALEETFVNKSGQSTLKLGQARGALLVTAANTGLNMAEYAPNLVKKSLTGAGRADKNQIGAMIRILLPKAEPDSEDAADALAVAICHAHHG